MSVCPSVSLGAGSQEPRPTTPPHLHLPALPWEQDLEQVWSPGLVAASRQGLGLSLCSGSRVLCVCVCVVCACVHAHVWACVRACMYMGNLCASMYKGEGQVTEAGRRGCLRQGLPGVASSQVDSPQVSGRCDGVALRAELLGAQGPQPALLAVHMPTLDGREGHRVGVHTDEAFVTVPTG